MAIKLVISGYCGRMGSRIAALALAPPPVCPPAAGPRPSGPKTGGGVADSTFTIGGALEASGYSCLGRDAGECLGLAPLGVRVTDDARAALDGGDVLVEFSSPAATAEHVRIARQLKKPAVIGTTGLSDAERAAIVDAAKDIPIVLSPNMSVGVNLLFELAELAAKRLGLGYDVEVVEAHHRAKKDAPSGTAKRLAEGLAASRRQPVSQIPVHALRAGDIVGDHTVILAGPAERLELTHRAQSRDAFAQGALKAAAFVRSQKPGLYDMRHVLNASAQDEPR